jgi:hypothetical protein
MGCELKSFIGLLWEYKIIVSTCVGNLRAGGQLGYEKNQSGAAFRPTPFEPVPVK